MMIYTKQGDQGLTRLGNGIQVSKDDLSIEAIGSVDELNALIGLVGSRSGELKMRGDYPSHTSLSRSIQNSLFKIGAELCLSSAKYDDVEKDIAYLEERIDFFDKFLKPLKNFILPGGNSKAAWYHYARTVCRRAERNVISYFKQLEQEQVPHNKNIIVYLNRLSDLLFTLARYENDGGTADVIWTHS